MNLVTTTVNCQEPESTACINRIFNIIQCSLQKGSSEYEDLLQKAKTLAEHVNPRAANHSEFERNLTRRQIDAFGGLCAEYAWEKYINSIFGGIASPTPFSDASVQIDILLTNGEKIEVRSSFPYKGVKFALCNNYANFKNIGPYSNTIKPGEIQKNLYLCVLYDTAKKDLLTAETISLSLVGGSTWDMMRKSGLNVSLKPLDDDSFATTSEITGLFI